MYTHANLLKGNFFIIFFKKNSGSIDEASAAQEQGPEFKSPAS